ncbi:MAG: hypothetical protein ACYCTI_09665 [Acidimicrobiales bacterium]
MEVAELLERARPVALAGQRALPVTSALASLLPGGLRRGSTVAVGAGTGATSLLLALLAGASAEGSWAALVGMPEVGPEAAASMGVDLGRLTLVPDPGEQWPAVVSALLDGVDLVAVRLGGRQRPRPVEARRLAARARHQSSILMVTGATWPEGCDLSLDVVAGEWEGLGAGYGSLSRRRVEVAVGGRRAASRRRQAALWLPDYSGRPEPIDDTLMALRTAGGGAGDPAGQKNTAGGGAGAPAVRRSRGVGDPAGQKL